MKCPISDPAFPGYAGLIGHRYNKNKIIQPFMAMLPFMAIFSANHTSHNQYKRHRVYYIQLLANI